MRSRRTQLPRVEGEQEVRKALKALLKVEGTRGLARRLKLSPAAISLVATGKERVSPRIAQALGFEKVIVYRVPPTPTEVNPRTHAKVQDGNCPR